MMTEAQAISLEGIDVDREFLTVDQIAEHLQVKQTTVRKWLREGRLRGINLGGVAGWRVRREELDRFIRELEDGQGAE